MQLEPMLRETAVPAVQVSPVLEKTMLEPDVSGISNAVEPTQTFSACNSVFFETVCPLPSANVSSNEPDSREI